MSVIDQTPADPDLASMSEAKGLSGLAAGTRHGAAPVVTAAVLAFALVNLAWGKLHVGQAYAEPIVGGITWNHLDKGRDFRALSLFLGATAAVALAIGGLFRRLSSAGTSCEVGRTLNALLWIALAPASWWLGSRLAYPDGYAPPYEAAGAVLLVLAATAGLRRLRRELTADLVLDVVGGAAMAVLLGAMGGSAVALAIGRLDASACQALTGFAGHFVAAGTAVTVLAIASGFAVARDPLSLRTWVFRSLLAVQVPLPLLFLAILSPQVVVGDEALPVPYKAHLSIGVALLIAVSWLGLAHRWWRWERTGGAERLGGVLSALCLSAIAVYYQGHCLSAVAVYYQGHLTGPPSLIGDHFHVGEQMLPWQQWADFGLTPFVDFIPIHGLMPLLRGWINATCFQGTAATFFMAEPILYGLSVLATFLTVAALAGTPTALLVSLLVGLSPGYGDRLYFLAPAILVLAHPRLRARPACWLLAWPVVVGLMVFYNPSVGVAYTLGTAPAAAWMVWRLAREAPRAAIRLGLAGAAVIAAVSLLTPAPEVIQGFLRFLSENASHNQVLHGTPMELSFGPIPDRLGLSANHFLFKIMRFAWIGVVVAAAAIAWSELGRPRGQRRPEILWIAGLTAATLLWNTSWAMGRIDSVNLTRTGRQSVVALTVLLPTLLVVGRNAVGAAPVVASLPLVVGLMAPPEASSILRPLLDRPFYAHRLPEGTEFVDGEGLGLPNVGRILDAPALLAELVELKEVLGPLIGPGETFLDLTNQSSYYYYLGLPVPALYSANFVAGNGKMQARMLERLRDQPPPVVLIAPAIEHDSGPASLRSYHLYREYLGRYVAVQRGRFTMLVDPSKIPGAGPVGDDEPMALLEAVFAPPDLHRLPEAWGRSAHGLAEHFEVVAPINPERLVEASGAEQAPGGGFTPTGPEAVLVYRVGDLDLDGRDADYLVFDFDYVREPGSPDAQIEVGWDANGRRTDGALRLDAARSTLLVPMGAHPRWLLGGELEALRIRVRSPEGFRRFSIANVRLLRLVPPL